MTTRSRPTLPEPKRARGQGYLKKWQGKDGRWRVRVFVFLAQDPLTKKQDVRRKTFIADELPDAQRAADEFAATTRAAFHKGTLADPSRDTLAAWGRRWLDERMRPVVKRSTWAGYDGIFRTTIEAPTDPQMPRLGKLQMAKLRPQDVRALYDYLSTTPNARGVINRGRAKTLHAVLRQLLTDAEVDGAVDAAAKLVTGLRRAFHTHTKPRTKRPQAFTGEQLDAFLQAADADPYRAFWYLFVCTGARPGELLALRWPAVDLQAHTIHITQTLHRVPKVPVAQRWEFTDAKTENADREIEFPAEVVPLLQQHKQQQTAALKQRKSISSYADLVFTTRRGQPVDWLNMTKQYQRICRRAKLGTFAQPLGKPVGRPGPAKQPKFTPLLTPYHLRHTHATLMRDEGVPIDVISARLGHYKASFTQDTYVGKRTGGQQVAVAFWSKRLRKTATM